MNEQDILTLIAGDQWRMGILRRAEKLHLPHWAIGAGFVRNKVWDHLSGFNHDTAPSDVDLIYFDPTKKDQKADETLSAQLKAESGIEWEIVNEAYAHLWSDIPPYTSMEDALSQWPETATAIAVNLQNGKLQLIAPYGIDDLVHMIVRPSPKFLPGAARVLERVEQKRWREKWPAITLWNA